MRPGAPSSVLPAETQGTAYVHAPLPTSSQQLPGGANGAGVSSQRLVDGANGLPSQYTMTRSAGVRPASVAPVWVLSWQQPLFSREHE